MSGPIRTYNPSVRVGNWSEDIQLEEDTLKDFLEKKENGGLLFQKSSRLRELFLKDIQLNIARDGKVHFDDVVMIVNPTPKDESRTEGMLCVNMTALAMHKSNDMEGPCGVSLSHNVKPCVRSAFVIKSCDGSPPGISLRYGQPFYLKALGGELYLRSDRTSFTEAAKKSRHSEVTLVTEPSHLTEWKIDAFNPEYRIELEWAEVPANEKVIITHVRTNKNLCVETKFNTRTPFGWEDEMSAHTSLDSHRAETDCNHYMIVMQVPGDTYMPNEPPAPDQVGQC